MPSGSPPDRNGNTVVAMTAIPFTRPYRAGRELDYVRDIVETDSMNSDGRFSRRALEILADLVGGHGLLTPSCTHALELAAFLLDCEAGDEVIMPSFTFVSTANAFALRGAVPVFVDIRPDTLNIDERLIESAITPRTKAIVVVHYAGVACEMDAISRIAERHSLVLIEDNAHGLGASYRGKPLGSFGAMATQSFHVTKNIQCGEGGAFITNDERLFERAEIIREKGTNRSLFFRGMVDKYRWVDFGSSYLPSELAVAYLVAQLEAYPDIHKQRAAMWQAYHTELAGWAEDNGVTQPTIPDGAEHPSHLYYLLMPSPQDQRGLIDHLKAREIQATFHYVPLHSAPAGEKLGRTAGDCAVTDDVWARLVRLPLFAGATDDEIARVIEAVCAYRPLTGQA